MKFSLRTLGRQTLSMLVATTLVSAALTTGVGCGGDPSGAPAAVKKNSDTFATAVLTGIPGVLRHTLHITPYGTDQGNGVKWYSADVSTVNEDGSESGSSLMFSDELIRAGTNSDGNRFVTFGDESVNQVVDYSESPDGYSQAITMTAPNGDKLRVDLDNVPALDFGGGGSAGGGGGGLMPHDVKGVVTPKEIWIAAIIVGGIVVIAGGTLAYLHSNTKECTKIKLAESAACPRPACSFYSGSAGEMAAKIEASKKDGATASTGGRDECSTACICNSKHILPAKTATATAAPAN